MHLFSFRSPPYPTRQASGTDRPNRRLSRRRACHGEPSFPLCTPCARSRRRRLCSPSKTWRSRPTNQRRTGE